MEENYKSGELEMLANLSTEFCQFDNCIVYSHLVSEQSGMSKELMNGAVKVEDSLFMLLVKGKINLNFNFQNYEVEAPAALSFPPGTVVQWNNCELSGTDIHMLGYKQSFLQDVNISFNSISGEIIMGRECPAIKLTDSELSLLLRYFSLMWRIMSDTFNTQLTRHILSNMTSAIFYQLILLLYKKIDTSGSESIGPRRSNYVHDFIKLVHLNYTKERSVNFYASKLFISPKYLSLLVKEATGRSAAKWIDHFVIMEAKNLLRYSGKNIQQVAYALNFSNQSSFGKYFKHLTGMSPTDYQKS